MRKFLILAFAATSIIYAGCEHEPVLPKQTLTPVDTTHKPPPQNDSVCFNTQILPLFISNCAQPGCHDATTHAEGYNLTTYTGIKRGIVAGNPSSGKIMSQINRGEMPPSGPLPAEQLALLNKWITEGALNRTCVDPCDTTVYTFKGGVKPIMGTFCVGCHKTTAPNGGIVLETYDQVKTQCTTGKLICSIEHGTGCSAMPKGTAKLSDNCIRVIKKWVAAGTPNN